MSEATPTVLTRPGTQQRAVLQLAAEAARELERAIRQHGPMHGPHEGYAVILEELEELWDLVKAYPKRATLEAMRGEAVQVAAMALRFILEVCPPAEQERGQ